ncbi:protein-associating with the carboxyl-terminal domain of ezrin [Anthonomus grandis grandis]|uniref:protein-associating with the carboxyl-terminal domain of ezrin n=1 Tax=Anthonomus grandis grandis TaxID=2921223 RepID=UPI002166BD5F|nr:protein-associating with the carboxyl-terminal domain of ezrin [Anthonomus grandis grandis]
MGNEQSQMSDVEVDDTVTVVSDFWSQHGATINGSESGSSVRVTLFAGELLVEEPFWRDQQLTPLEKFSKNIKIYRHPSIVKYITSWQKSSKYYLAVEEVSPLAHLIQSHLSPMEVCLGLYSILKAIDFLHSKASVSHNNVSVASIMVNKEGNWKLGGMEYLCPYNQLNPDYVRKTEKWRGGHKIPDGAESLKDKSKLDLVGFCATALDLLKNSSDPNASRESFQNYCTKVLEDPNHLQTTTLQNLLDHPYFKHPFITIHSFLIELPLKSDPEKSEFFKNLEKELRALDDEELVAGQLGGLLVSRLVLLNQDAQECVLPYIMVPRKGTNDAIFSLEVFKTYIAPKLLRIFPVRDAQIRRRLLDYLPQCFDCFSRDDLQFKILPELLVGIKDLDDELVCATLHTLAALVPVLGAHVVISGERAKLFNDGRPNSRAAAPINGAELGQVLRSADVEGAKGTLGERPDLPERPRPDGEEGETSTEDVEQSGEESADNWEDWGEGEGAAPPTDVNRPKRFLDITELDIKAQPSEEPEVDFFADMEPEIRSSRKFLTEKTVGSSSSMFSVKNEHQGDEEGWDDDWA